MRKKISIISICFALSIILWSFILLISFSEGANGIGGWDVRIILDENTTSQTVDISSSGSQSIDVLGQITLQSSYPHVLQNIEVTIILDMEPTPYDMDEHLQNNYIVNPDPIVFQRVVPNSLYRENFTVSIYFDKNFISRDYVFSIQGLIENNPGTTSGMTDVQHFYIDVIPFIDGDVEGPEEVEIDINNGGSYSLKINNLGNVEADLNYQIIGIEDAEREGIIIDPSIGPNVDPLLNGESRIISFKISTENPGEYSETEITFIWYKDSSRSNEFDRITTIIFTIGEISNQDDDNNGDEPYDDPPQTHKDDELPSDDNPDTTNQESRSKETPIGNFLIPILILLSIMYIVRRGNNKS